MPATLALSSNAPNPLDTFEQIADANDWTVERTGSDEITMLIDGSWSPLHLSLNWHEDMEGLFLACAFDMKVPKVRRAELTRLLAMINERLVFGHFDIWFQEGSLLFRNGLVLGGGATANSAQCETLLRQALQACERYYPCFQFLIWAGQSAEDALNASLLETAGEA